MHDESKFEWGAGLADAGAERASIAKLTADAQSIFLALQALVHHRLSIDFTPMPVAVRKEIHALGAEVVSRLESFANRMEGRITPTSADLTSRLAHARQVVDEVKSMVDPQLMPHLPGRLALYEDLLAKITQFDRDSMPPTGPRCSAAHDTV